MRSGPKRGAGRWRGGVWPTVIVCVLLLLTACGGDKERSGQPVAWHEGTPPAIAGQMPAAPPTQAGKTPASAAPTAGHVGPTPTQPAPSPPAAANAAGSDHILTPAELDKYRPNELGKIPILEYHQIVTDPKQEAQFVRTAEHFRQDLEWLYEHNFYDVSLQSVADDAIAAPAGKHPVVLTFDDSSGGQFRYLKGADGQLTIDPNSAVGVMEDFFAKHPDFGRGATFFTLPNNCFDWPEQADANQEGYCKQKLEWLLAHGYDIGEHTLTHADLLNVDDATFKKEVGGAVVALQEIVPNIKIDLFALPNGDYPDAKKHQDQRDWLENGFEYEGQFIKFKAVMAVGAGPAPAPAGTDWDPGYVARIQAFNTAVHNEWGGLDTWFPQMADNPLWLYTSDGNPNTIAFPKDLPGDLAPLDQARVGDKQVIQY